MFGPIGLNHGINFNNMKELNKFREFLAENAIANDKGDGTFEITADIDILGKKFNFSDICPGAHKAIADLANEYKNDEGKLGDLLVIANAHQDFFALEKKALAAKKLSDDEVNDLKRLYTEITNMAFNAFGPEVGGDISEYMNMHMDKVKEAIGDFYNVGLEENDEALDEVLKEDPISITAIGRELASMDKEEALKTIDRLIDYLKTVEHRIITRG